MEEEGKLGIPVTTYMMGLDKVPTMAKQEMQFVNVIIKPLWTVVNDFFNGELKECVENCQENIKKWDEVYKQSIEEAE